MLRRALLLALCGGLVASIHAVTPGRTLAETEETDHGLFNVSGSAVIFDNQAANGGLNTDGATPASQRDTVFPFEAGAADDFTLPESPECTWAITGVRWWGAYWGPGTAGTLTGFRIVFWPDEGGVPAGAALLFPESTPDYTQALAVYEIPGPAGETPDATGYEYFAQLPEPFEALSGISYWVQIQADAVFPPQWGWHVTSLRQGHGPVVFFDLLGLPVWTSHPDGGDLAFQLLGEPRSIDCDDGNACTANDCVNGTCVFTPIVCDDDSHCTTDSCDPEVGCVFTEITCDDNDACTENSCDPASGCVFTPISCDDGDACTDDSCDSDIGCVFTPIVCDDGNACTENACDPETGCAFAVVHCDDGDACTLNECDSETGCVFTPIDCDDGDACTDNTCDPVEGCMTTPVVCDDGNACTEDACDESSGCTHGSVVCDDGDACTEDSCNPETGCVFTPIVCDDGNACTTNDCNPASGCVFAPIDCDDGDACTTDSCDTETGCTHTDAACDDGDACTEDSCDPETGCVFTAITCDDGDPCTVNSCDPEAGCIHTPMDCNDDDPCTIDTCVEGECVFTPDEECGDAEIDCAPFHECLTGPGGGPLSEECLCRDSDGDGDVDMLDWIHYETQVLSGQ